MLVTFAGKNGLVALRHGKRFVLTCLIITLFLLAVTVPLAQAKNVKDSGINVYQERRGVTRFEERIPLSPELGLPSGSFYKVNVYAFQVKGGIVLVDSGVESLYAPLMDEIGKKFHNKPILAVLLTHAHADHAGAGSYFVRAGVPVYAPIADSFLIEMGMDFPGVPSDFSYTGYAPTVLLYGGETVFGLDVIPTPGHTAGSVSFVDEKTNALFSADTTIAYSDDDMAPLDMTYVLEFMTLQMTDEVSLHAQLDSLNVLAELSAAGLVDTILPGHNRVYYGKDVQPYIQNSIDVVTRVLMMYP